MNIYLINAESYRLIDREIKKIVGNNVYTVFNMNKISINEVIEEASYYSLDNTNKYIVVTNADFFGSGKISDSDNQLLQAYMASPNKNTILIFTTQQGIDARKKIVKEIKASNGLINIPKMDKRGINNILTNYLKEFDYSIDYNTINYIMDNCYNNLDIMFNELDKIMLFYSFPGKIKIEDVKKIVGEEVDCNNFHFVNAVVEKKLDVALKILKGLKVYKVETIGLVVLLAREYRLMYYVKKLFNKVSLQEMCELLNLADWQVNKLYNNCLNYSASELLKNLVSLCNIDMNIKKGIWDKDSALYVFLLDACS